MNACNSSYRLFYVYCNIITVTITIAKLIQFKSLLFGTNVIATESMQSTAVHEGLSSLLQSCL